MFSKSDFIKNISSIPNRGSATAGEREAASRIHSIMKDIGLDAWMEEFKTPTRMPIIHFVHFFIIFLACLTANLWPVASMFAGFLVLISFWGEFTHKFFILRYLIPHKRSENVIGKLGPDSAKVKVVISAHMDAARAGLIFNPKLANPAGKLKHQPLHKSLMIIMAILVIVFIVKSFGGGTWVLSIIFNFFAVVAFAASALMLQWEFAKYSPGANDDLSGVAVMLGVADKLATLPQDDLQFIFVATGAEEAHCSGMKAYMKAHSHEFDKQSSYFINLECLGGGRLKYVTEEGFIVFQKHDHTLVQIADIVARKFKLNLEPTYTVAHSESIVPLTLGFKSIGLIALNENMVPTNYHQPSDVEANIDYSLLELAETAIIKMIDTLKDFRRMEFI